MQPTPQHNTLMMQQLQPGRVHVSQNTLNWLLEENEPSARHLTLTEILGKDQNDSQVEKARSNIGKLGWAERMFAEQKEETYWDNPNSCLVPKFSACAWRLIVLADIGVLGEDPRIRNSVDHFLEHHNVDDGGFSLRQKTPPREVKAWQFAPHICLTGNMVRTLAKLGYAQDPRVRKAMDWLVSMQLPEGGWNCSPQGKHGSFMATVQPLWALGEMMAHEPQDSWRRSRDKGTEFLLRHRVYKSDNDDSVVLLDFLKTHYPMHYCYDFLHGLRILTENGVKKDPRMEDAVRVLLSKRLEDGRWPLEGVYRGFRHAHPMHNWETVSRPEERELITEGWGTERAIQIEEAGRPSKWITLQALLVLKRLGLLSASQAG